MNNMRGILASINSEKQRLLLSRRVARKRSTDANVSHQQLLSMLDLAPIMMCDIDGTIRFWSDGCRRLYGWTAEQAIGQSSQDLLRTVSPVPFAQMQAELLRNGGWSGELTQSTRDGTEVIVSSRRELHRGAGGNHLSVHEVVTEPTRSFRTADTPPAEHAIRTDVGSATALSDTALRDSEARLRQFIDHAPAAIAMFDTDMRYIVVSRRYAISRILPASHDIDGPDALIGRDYYDLFPLTSENRRTIHRRTLAGEKLRGEADRHLLADGSIAWVSWEAVPWWKPDGTIGGSLVGFEDVTDRQVAVLALQASEARLRLVQQVGGIAYTDRTIPGQEALVSEEYSHIYGLPPGQMRAPTADFIAQIHPDDRHRIVGRTPTSLVGDGRLATEFRIWRPDGAMRWISIRAEAFLGPEGRPNRIISAQQDITELVATRETLALRNEELNHLSQHLAKALDRAEQANRAKSRFLAGMSHELRTPLNGIIGYARLLHMEGGMNAAQGARVDAMLEAGKHLLEMITGVLDLSEIEANHVELKPVSFDVQALAMTCLDFIRPTAQSKGLALSIAVAPGTRKDLIADPTRLRQVLLNLLGNAAKFTAQGSIELRLQSSPEEATLRIEVLDSGPGIGPELRQRLFQDFARLDVAGTSTAEGAGLGLALSARLATLMGGHLGHEDRPQGGSIFWLELPDPVAAASPEVAVEPTQQDALPPPALIRALHVLVVDDMLMNRDIASAFMRSAGHEVTCVDSGAAAVAAVADTHFDVVLMDIRMPGMDGLEATRRIRDVEGGRSHVPIVALTAQAFTEQVAQCRDAGMDDHLPKPFTPDQLLAAVARAVQTPTRVKTPSPVSAPAAASTSLTGEELPVFDPNTFKRTTDLLAPGAAVPYLRIIASNGEALLTALREPDALRRTPGELAEAAHALAGSAGMLGFGRLAAAGRRFARAATTGASEVPDLATGLAAALDATLLSIRDDHGALS